MSCTDKKQVYTRASLQRTSKDNPALPLVLMVGARFAYCKALLIERL